MPSLLDYPVHLGLGATAVPQPAFTGPAITKADWYQEYGDRHGADGAEGRLVSMHVFSASWDSWEMHPHGDEIVLCVAGSITLTQEHASGATATVTTQTVTIGPGEYVINPPGTWHTADVDGEATALFITAGTGTRHRPR